MEIKNINGKQVSVPLTGLPIWKWSQLATLVATEQSVVRYGLSATRDFWNGWMNTANRRIQEVERCPDKWISTRDDSLKFSRSRVRNDPLTEFWIHGRCTSSFSSTKSFYTDCVKWAIKMKECAVSSRDMQTSVKVETRSNDHAGCLRHLSQAEDSH
jgi:hypothetical protein